MLDQMLVEAEAGKEITITLRKDDATFLVLSSVATVAGIAGNRDEMNEALRQMMSWIVEHPMMYKRHAELCDRIADQVTEGME